MRTPKSQQGMTAIGWLIVLGLIGFFVLLALRMTPAYLEFATVKSSLESLKNEPGIVDKSPVEIRSMLGKRFGINDVKSIDPNDRKAVVIDSQGGRLNVSANYEVRVGVLGNVDAVMKFAHNVEVVRN